MGAAPFIGPADTSSPRPDLSVVFDPADIWPDPEACPDWPLMSDEQRRMNQPFTVADAESKLTRFAFILNGSFKTYEPDKAECASIIKSLFVTGHSGWPGLGLNVISRSPGSNIQEAMVQSAHIRGWLRKLRARKDRQAEDAAKFADSKKRAAYESFLASVRSMSERLPELEEAEARHNQRIEDERAAVEASNVRSGLRHSKFELARAARELGIPVPPEAGE